MTKGFSETLPTKIKPTKCPASWKKKNEARKAKREGRREIKKWKSKVLCYFQTQFCFLRMPEYSFSYPELRSSWPAPRIESSGRFQLKGLFWLADEIQKNQTGNDNWNDIVVNMADDSGTPTKRFSSLKDVCRTCNNNIILKNHPLDLFGDKAKEERIVADLEKMFGLKITRDDGLPSRTCRSCYGRRSTFQPSIDYNLT